MTHSEELHKYIKRIIDRISAEKNMEIWKPHLEQFSEDNDQIYDKVKETQANALDVDEVRKEWMSILNNSVNLNLNHSVIPQTESSSNHDLSVSSLNAHEKHNNNKKDSETKKNNNSERNDNKAPKDDTNKVHEDDNPDDEYHSDSSSSSSSSSASSSSYPKRKTKKRTNKHKDKKNAKYLMKKEEKQYREIVRNLIRTAKNFDIRVFHINSNPSIRRERFRIWVNDLNNILSTESKTSGILSSYPADLPKFSSLVDKIMKTILFSLTQGYAKQIVSSANSAHQSLLDLKRHCAQTSVSEKHNERQKLMNITQNFGEKASEFLKRVKQQLELCKSIGCNEFNDNEVIVNIILEGLNSNNRAYTATIAELKAGLCSISMTDLEEIFFHQ
jgi:hypothetical protein